jgi:hypothetical protein
MFELEVRRRAAPLLREMENSWTQISLDRQELADLDQVVAGLAGQTGWRERHLRGLFGGDRALAGSYRQFRRQNRALRRRIQRQESEHERIAVRVDRLVKPELLKVDPNYRSIVNAAGLFREALVESKKTRHEIRLAIDTLDGVVSSNVDERASPEQRLRAANAVRLYHRHLGRVRGSASVLSQRTLQAKFAVEQISGVRASEWADLDRALFVQLTIEAPIGSIRRDELLRRRQILVLLHHQAEELARRCRISYLRLKRGRQKVVRTAHRLL